MRGRFHHLPSGIWAVRGERSRREQDEGQPQEPRHSEPSPDDAGIRREAAPVAAVLAPRERGRPRAGARRRPGPAPTARRPRPPAAASRRRAAPGAGPGGAAPRGARTRRAPTAHGSARERARTGSPDGFHRPILGGAPLGGRTAHHRLDVFRGRARARPSSTPGGPGRTGGSRAGAPAAPPARPPPAAPARTVPRRSGGRPCRRDPARSSSRSEFPQPRADLLRGAKEMRLDRPRVESGDVRDLRNRELLEMLQLKDRLLPLREQTDRLTKPLADLPRDGEPLGGRIRVRRGVFRTRIVVVLFPRRLVKVEDEPPALQAVLAPVDADPGQPRLEGRALPGTRRGSGTRAGTLSCAAQSASPASRSIRKATRVIFLWYRRTKYSKASRLPDRTSAISWPSSSAGSVCREIIAGACTSVRRATSPEVYARVEDVDATFRPSALGKA